MLICTMTDTREDAVMSTTNAIRINTLLEKGLNLLEI